MIREMMSSLGMMDGWKELVSLAEVVHMVVVVEDLVVN